MKQHNSKEEVGYATLHLKRPVNTDAKTFMASGEYLQDKCHVTNPNHCIRHDIIESAQLKRHKGFGVLPFIINMLLCQPLAYCLCL